MKISKFEKQITCEMSSLFKYINCSSAETFKLVIRSNMFENNLSENVKYCHDWIDNIFDKICFYASSLTLEFNTYYGNIIHRYIYMTDNNLDWIEDYSRRKSIPIEDGLFVIIGDKDAMSMISSFFIEYPESSFEIIQQTESEYDIFTIETELLYHYNDGEYDV